MRTLIVSDLHLGNGGAYDAFAGEDALPALIERFVEPPSRVILNGDSLDFLMNDDPLELDAGRAAAQARAIAATPAAAGALAALGRVLEAGGEVLIRTGNHDLELALEEVQDVLRGALQQPAAVAARMQFSTGEAPYLLEAGGARILVTHGEHNDAWNRVDYDALTRPGKRFAYAPGSILVKQILNPLKRDHGLRFADLLKPDFQGAALTALAIAPDALRLVFKRSSFTMVWQLFRKMSMPLPFGETVEEADLGLSDRIGSASLTQAEQRAVEMMLGTIPLAFSDQTIEQEELDHAKLKLARAGLKLYAGIQRRISGSAGDDYFRLEPEPGEWSEARRLAQKFGAGAVILGHSHAARWKHEEGVVYANTGTWIWLMQLPPFDAGDEVWAEFLEELQDNPALSPERQRCAQLKKRLNAACVQPRRDGGALVSLLQVEPEGTTVTLDRAEVPSS